MRVCFLIALAALTACRGPAAEPSSPAPQPETSPTAPAQGKRDTVVVRDPELERRVARLELRLMEKEAQVEDLQTRLADSRDEIVRIMARVGGTASRAEAASAIAEADVALQALRSAGGSAAPELAQASRLAQQSNAEFGKGNYGGALYLANQAKQTAAAARGRLAGGQSTVRPGEALFAVPIRLKVTSRGNVREGPGTSYPVAFSVTSGTMLSAFSATDEWIRITDDGGRSGWIFRSLVGRP